MTGLGEEEEEEKKGKSKGGEKEEEGKKGKRFQKINDPKIIVPEGATLTSSPTRYSLASLLAIAKSFLTTLSLSLSFPSLS